MAAFDSYSGDIDAYLSGIRDPLATWGFVHIAKTAGTSLISELNSKFPPYYNIYTEYKIGGERSYHIEMQKAIDKFVSVQSIRPQRCFSGHFSMIDAIAIRNRLPGTRFFTFLRDPVERVVSQYRYSLTEADPNHLDFAVRYPTIEAYVADPISQNLMYKILRPRAGATPEETAAFAVKFFDFIALSEAYSICASILFDLMGRAHVPTNKINVTRDTDANQVVLSPSLRNHILGYNMFDHVIYHKVADMLLPILRHFEAQAANPE